MMPYCERQNRVNQTFDQIRQENRVVALSKEVDESATLALVELYCYKRVGLLDQPLALSARILRRSDRCERHFARGTATYLAPLYLYD